MHAPLKIVRGTARLESGWPGGIQVAALPGIVGQPDAAYPASTTNALKLLRRDGLRAERVQDAPEIKLMANEVWLPFLVAALSISADLIVRGIVGLLEREPAETLVHARFGRLHTDEITYEWIELEGPRAEVAAAVREFFIER